MQDIAGWEGLYAVTEDGRVWAHPKSTTAGSGIKYHVGHWMKSHAYSGRTNHQRVYLSRDGKKVGMQVHRLVADAFLPNPDCQPVVNHLDGDPLNNRVENLEWTTHSGNCIHAVRMGLTRLPNQRGASNSNARLTDASVLEMRTMHSSGVSVSHISKVFGVASKTVRDAVTFKSWKHLGA